MENIARIKLLITLKTGPTGGSTLYVEGAELTAPFPRIIREEFARNRGTIKVLEYRTPEPEKPSKTSAIFTPRNP